MGIVSFSGSLKQRIRVVCNDKKGYFLPCFLFLGMLRRPSMGRSQKNYDKAVCQEGGTWHLPSCFIAGCPHLGQRQMSKFQTAFKSSAMDIPA